MTTESVSTGATVIPRFTEDQSKRRSGNTDTIDDMVLNHPTEVMHIRDVAAQLDEDEQTIREWVGDGKLESPKEDPDSVYRAVKVPKVAKWIGVDEQTVRAWIRRGKLSATQWGPDDSKVIRVDLADLKGLGPRDAGPTTLVLHLQRDQSANTLRFHEVGDSKRAIAGMTMTKRALEELGEPADLTITVRAGAPSRRGRPRKTSPTR